MAFSFGDDDGGFGEFNFFVSLSPSPQQHIPHHRQQQQDRDDDDWGDFVQSPQSNSIPPPSSSSPHNNVKWEKPTGAIPLSIFGVEDEEEEPPEPTQFLFNNNSNNGLSSPSTPKPFARDVMDLISDLYAQPPPPANASTGSDLPKEKDHCEDGDVDEDDDNSWEFKDAFSPIKGGGDGNGNGIQAAGIGLKTVLEACDQLRVHNGGSEPCRNLYSAQDRGANGLNFDSDIAYRHFISDTSRHTHCTSNGNGMHPSLENGVESIDDKMWDFKDAFTRDAVESGSLGKPKTPPDHEPHMFMRGSKVQGSGDWFISSRGDLLTSTSDEGKEEFSGSSRTLNGYLSGPNSVQTEIKALDPVVAYLNSGCQIDKGLYYYSTPNSCLDFYHRLKEESIFLIICHLGDLKKSHEGAALSGEEAKILKINENIQAVYKVLQEVKISENAYIRKHSSKGARVNQLVEVTKEPYFWAVEEEYRLSERILSAEKELRASIELFGHTSSVIHILRLASKEEQQAYISAWSTMARACTKELQHGAMIWKESLDTNISKEILSLGSGYFAALAEIYRVTEILRVSLKLYKPWILSNPEDCSWEVVSCLKKCAELWATSGLEFFFENRISADTIDCKVKMPAKSIKLLHDLDELSFQNHAFDHDNVACKLSLLPIDKLQDTKVITWNGDQYCLKLANFWANRVSCDPPQLPHIPTS